MWLPRMVAAVASSTRPVAIVGGEPVGAPFVIDALREQARVAWFEVGGSIRDDVVAQGNTLARAVNAVMPGQLLTTALPYSSHLSAMRRHKDAIQPLWLVATLTVDSQPLVEELLDLHEHGYRVMLDIRGEPPVAEGALGRCALFGPEELHLPLDEARQVAPRMLPSREVERLWRATDGRFGDFTREVLRAAGLPRALIPSAHGSLVDERDALAVEPAQAVHALRREGELVAALELAVLKAPQLVDELLRQAGPRYQEDGLLTRLHLLLSALDEPYSLSERVLEWRLVAAFHAGETAEVVSDVDAHLETHTAPDLRARRAGTMQRTAGFVLAQQAVEAKRSPLTVWQYGRLHPNHEASVELLREAVQLADDQGTRYEVARNADTLAAKLYQVGQFAGAASWARWALDVFDGEQLHDGPRRLLILNNLAAARILSGDLVGLRRSLEDALALVEGNLPGLATMFRGTVAMLELAEGRPQEALRAIAATYDASPRRHRARFGYQYVRVLLELGRLDEARQIAADVSEVSRGGPPHEPSLAALARGMVGAIDGAERAVWDLTEAMIDPLLTAEQRLPAALYYLAVSGGAAHNVPADLAQVLGTLHPVALHVLSGPAASFAEVWPTLATTAPASALELSFLGRTACRYQGVPVTLAPRLAEVTLALALRPDGISRDELNDFLTPEGREPYSSGGIRGMMTRLRGILPVSDAPYRITVPYQVDVLTLRKLLGAGKVREAAALLRGQLLPFSEAPGVVEQRWALEEQLRQAALMNGDPEVLYDLAERLGDDLEFWEATADALGSGDPRLALARARVRRLEEAYGLSQGRAVN